MISTEIKSMYLLNDDELFKSWKSKLQVGLEAAFGTLQEQEIEPHTFTFYTSVSVMSSCRIEGEQLEVDSYVKHKLLHVEYLPELTEKPNDLYRAYLFAKDNGLSQQTFHQAHHLLTAHLLPEKERGILRHTEMLVMEHQTGRIQYEAAHLSVLSKEYSKLWNDISILLDNDLTTEESFFYAAYIHLAFVNIHPFSDGNGRAARLLEKWFLAQKLGDNAWYIQSEKYYYARVGEYYMNLAKVGMSYDQLDYKKAVAFLSMLPQAVVSR